MKNYKPILMLGAAVIVGLLTSVLTYDWLKNKVNMKPDASIATQQIAVAAGDLARGTVLNKEMIKMAEYVKDNLPEGSFTDASSLLGRVMIYPAHANEPIFESRLAPKDVTSGGVAVLIDKSMRAMTVKVDKVIGVSGFVHPGNRVDVLVTLKRADKTNIPYTKTILENVPVLVAGTEMEKRGRHGKAVEVDVITLEVTPTDAEKLALAATEGKIQLALRSFNDSEEVITRGATPASLLASYSPASPPVKKKAVRKIRRVPKFSVEVVRGDKVSKMKFTEGKI